MAKSNPPKIPAHPSPGWAFIKLLLLACSGFKQLITMPGDEYLNTALPHPFTVNNCNTLKPVDAASNRLSLLQSDLIPVP